MSISWNDLKQYHFNPPNILLPRKEKVQKKYDVHKKKIGIPIDKYILNTILHDVKFKITINLFPYDLEKNILHYILWISPNHKLFKNEIESIINNYFKCQKFICYQNKIEAKSIKTIEHYHIFILQNM